MLAVNYSLLILLSCVFMQSFCHTPLYYEAEEEPFGGREQGGGGGFLEEEASGSDAQLCTNVSQVLLGEIETYRGVVQQIGQLILNGSFKGVAYGNLSDFVDSYGARLTGSEALEKSIDRVLEILGDLGLDNVHSENVVAPKWVRGHESLEMIGPYKKRIQVLGLLPTAQTPEAGITSEIVVVNSFRDLKENIDNVLSRVKGKILVFNHPFDDAVNAVRYRHRGAIEGAKVGAIATIVRYRLQNVLRIFISFPTNA